ncbi:hypothetical protein Syun_031105 [Stephania yunnanensis]|uniref:Uncharacterized protein n=1 Tax=Stephania yunnanensis TaxID=152371 RepID=A0AAP0DUG3_9MAGN
MKSLIIPTSTAMCFPRAIEYTSSSVESTLLTEVLCSAESFFTLRSPPFHSNFATSRLRRSSKFPIFIQIIRDFIQDCEYASVEELCEYSYQLFVDMSNWFLAQFPASIFREVHESPVEDYEERARFILKLLYKLEPSLEDKVQWSFPVGANITHFLDPYLNFDEGIPSDTILGGAATAKGPSTTDSIPSSQDVELGQAPM